MPAFVREKPHARDFWKAHAKDLQRSGRLNESFRLTFARLCMLYARVMEYTEIIDSEGATVTGPRGGKTKHPLTTPLAQTERLFMDLAAKFGLEPASNARIPKTPPRETDESGYGLRRFIDRDRQWARLVN
jgi:P27 family predicted phage terminase small subunit